MEALSTPPQPHPSPTPFGDFRTNTYRYDPALSAVLHLPPQASAVPMTKTSSGGEGAGWQAGLLLVLRRDGVVHAVCLHSALTVAPFAACLGPGAVLGGWEPSQRLLLSGNVDGFVRLLRVAATPHEAKLRARAAALGGLGEGSAAGGTVEVLQTWRAHTAQISQTALLPQEPGGACFATAATDGSVKLWGLDGSPIRALGMSGAQQAVVDAGRMLLGRMRGRRSPIKAKGDRPQGAVASPKTLFGLKMTDVEADENKEKTGRRRRKAGHLAKIQDNVEQAEAEIIATSRAYRSGVRERLLAAADRAKRETEMLSRSACTGRSRVAHPKACMDCCRERAARGGFAGRGG